MQFCNLTAEFLQSLKICHFSSSYIDFWGLQIPPDWQIIDWIIIDIDKIQSRQLGFEKLRSIIDRIVGDK